MKIKFFINRPIFSIALAILIVCLGLIAYGRLPVEQFPDIAPPVVEISAEYTGASADAVQKSVVVPIEEAINGIDGIDYISSSATSTGSAGISVVFKSGIDPDMAVVQVKNHLAEAEGILPQEVIETGVHVEKEQRAYLKVIALECPDDRYDNDFISNYFDINISPRLQRIKGVGNVQLLGNIYAMRIWMDPSQMVRYNLSPSDIEEALNGQNVEAAIGTLGEGSANTFQQTLVYSGRLTTAEEFSNIVLKTLPGGGDLKLGDVARCELGSESYSTDGWVNGHNGVVAILSQTSGSNAREVNHEIDRLLEQLKPSLPAGLEFCTLLDTNDFLDASMSEVYKTLLAAILLVVLVVLLFLRNGRATLIPSIAIVVSLIGTFAFMYVAGFSLNLITLFALVLVIGTVVDDAIVVVEAVQSQFERGERSPYKAVVGAMGNIGKAVVTTTVVFMCVFIPTAFISGLSGAYYRQFGLTMAVAVALSTVNALTLSPALSALLMRPTGQRKAASRPSRLAHFVPRFSRLTSRYLSALGFFTRHKWAVAAITVGFVALAAFMLRQIPTSLIPDEDTGNVFVDITTPPGSTLEQTKKTVRRVAAAVEDLEEVEACASIAGWNILGGDGANTGILILKLKHWDERTGAEHRIDNVLERIEERIDTIHSADMFAYPLPTVTGYGFGSGIELYVQNFGGEPIERIKEVTDSFVDSLQHRKEIGDVYCTYEVNYPQYTVSVNASICKRYGVEPADVLGVLGGYIGSNYASQFNAFGRLYHVMLQADPHLRDDRNDLDNIIIRNEGGLGIPITELISLKKSYGVQSLERFNLYSCIGIEVEPADGYSTGDAIGAIGQVAQARLPHGYGFEFAGTAREEAALDNSALWTFVIVLLFSYLVLCALYESLFIPVAVLLCVPFGLVGCSLFALAFGLENNIYAQVGINMVIGLLAKTAIMLTEYATELHRQGLSIPDAALQAAKSRLRPIAMTAITLIIGLLPLAFASGAGAMGNISLGLCVIGGMVVGTLALLLFLPVFFIVLQRVEERFRSRPKRPLAALPLMVLALLSLGGCSTYSSYVRPVSDTTLLLRSDLPIAPSGTPPTSDSTLPSFRLSTGDTLLLSLVNEGLAHNNDLLAARMGVDAARAALRSAKADLFPSLGLGASGESSLFRNGHDNMEAASFTFGLEASWEVDLFGRLRNAKQVAAATLEERQAYAQAVQVELVATIATAYCQLLMYDAQIAENQAVIDSWDESVRTLGALVAVGEATSDEVSQAEAARLEAELTFEQLRLQLFQAENALCSLLGRQSGHIARSDLASFRLAFATDTIPLQALASRPDVRQAEAELKRAFYATAEARASLYPTLNLSGIVGWTNDIGEVVSPAGMLARALGQLSAPLFSAGRLRAEVRAAEADQQAALASFRQALLVAGQEVNDHLAARQYAVRAINLRSRRAEKLSEVLSVTQRRMRHDSEVNYLQVLLARQALLECRLELVADRYALIESTIALYRALGGKFTLEE